MLAELARELLAIAASGLKRQQRINARGEDERIYLERLEDIVRRGKSLGRILQSAGRPSGTVTSPS